MWVAAGLALVAIDVRTERLDVLPDALGWLSVAFGAWRLSIGRAAAVAAAAAMLSVSEVHLPYESVVLDPRTGEEVRTLGDGSRLREHVRSLDVSGWRLAAMTMAIVAGGVALWLLLTELERRSADAGRHPVPKALLLLRWLMVGVWAVPYLAVVVISVVTDSDRFDPMWNGGLELVWLAGALVLAGLVIVLGEEANRAWATPEGVVQPSPWGRHR